MVISDNDSGGQNNGLQPQFTMQPQFTSFNLHQQQAQNWQEGMQVCVLVRVVPKMTNLLTVIAGRVGKTAARVDNVATAAAAGMDDAATITATSTTRGMDAPAAGTATDGTADAIITSRSFRLPQLGVT